MSKVFPTATTSSVDVVHGGEVKKYLSPSSELLVTWESEQYSNMACLYGFSDDRVKIVENDNRLFLGFSDAAPNVVLSPDPFPCRRLYLVLVDPRSRNFYQTAGDVFSNIKWPELSELSQLADCGGYILRGKGVTRSPKTKSIFCKRRVKLGIIYLHGLIDESSMKDEKQKTFLKSLNIRCNLHFCHDNTTNLNSISTLEKHARFVIDLKDRDTLEYTSTINGLVEFLADKFVDVLPYITDVRNYPISLSSNACGKPDNSHKLLGWFQILFYLLLGLSKADIVNHFFDKPLNNKYHETINSLLLQLYRPTVSAYLDSIESNYGSIDIFLASRLKITSQDQLRLQKSFLVDINFIDNLRFEVSL